MTGWLGQNERVEKAGLQLSTSHKGRSPDNATCEGFWIS